MITANRVRELFDYNPTTGLLTWKEKRNGMRSSRVAGTKMQQGYVRLRVDGIDYLAHRLIWLYVNGHFPSDFIDHINGDVSDNRIANLREATDAQNKRNRAKLANNKSGYKGVYFHKRSGKWRAKIASGGFQQTIGSFPTPQEAHAAYCRAAKLLHGQFARTE